MQFRISKVKPLASVLKSPGSYNDSDGEERQDEHGATGRSMLFCPMFTVPYGTAASYSNFSFIYERTELLQVLFTQMRYAIQWHPWLGTASGVVLRMESLILGCPSYSWMGILYHRLKISANDVYSATHDGKKRKRRLRQGSRQRSIIGIYLRVDRRPRHTLCEVSTYQPYKALYKQVQNYSIDVTSSKSHHFSIALLSTTPPYLTLLQIK